MNITTILIHPLVEKNGWCLFISQRVEVYAVIQQCWNILLPQTDAPLGASPSESISYFILSTTQKPQWPPGDDSVAINASDGSNMYDLSPKTHGILSYRISFSLKLTCASEGSSGKSSMFKKKKPVFPVLHIYMYIYIYKVH